MGRPSEEELPVLYGLEPEEAVARATRLGLACTIVRCDDPRGAHTGSDVVIAARHEAGRVELVVGGTLPVPGGAA